VKERGRFGIAPDAEWSRDRGGVPGAELLLETGPDDGAELVGEGPMDNPLYSA
jgi:hypothetical protein